MNRSCHTLGRIDQAHYGVMRVTPALERTLAELAKLPESEQDAIAAWLMEEIESERRWSESFERSADLLSQLADEALADLHEGRTEPLDPDRHTRRTTNSSADFD
jgi:hypothetical protein